MKVLIVQDDTSSRTELEKSLKEWGYDTLSAQNVEEALQVLQDGRPQILLVDEAIAGADRLEFCKKVRSQCKKIYIIFLMSKSENIGADDYLVKPLDKIILKDVMAIASKFMAGENANAVANILHNVGNALNSISISTGTILEKVANMEIANLAQLAGILDGHSEDLAEFLMNTVQGKNVIPYLKQVSLHLLQQQTQAAEKLCSVIKNIEDLKNIVNVQQNTKTQTQEEGLFLNELIENAVEINASMLERNNIEIIREYEDIGRVFIDRQRTLQILINLIDNAGWALSKSGNEPKLLRIRLSKSNGKSATGGHASGETSPAGGKVKIEITDNGIGINPENLGAIFEQGWTTKEGGHGFGLHGSKLAANEMQSQLWAKSDGVNLGATFTLELPLKKVEVKNGKQN